MTRSVYSLTPDSLTVGTGVAKSTGASHTEAPRVGEPCNHICIEG